MTRYFFFSERPLFRFDFPSPSNRFQLILGQGHSLAWNQTKEEEETRTNIGCFSAEATERLSDVLEAETLFED